MTHPRHELHPDTDPRLLDYAATSWNAHEAVYALQQMTGLLPVFTQNLEGLRGSSALGPARRLWVRVADLVTTILQPAASDLSIADLKDLDTEVPLDIAQYSLSESLALRHVDFSISRPEDLVAVLGSAIRQDRVIKALLHRLQEELRAFEMLMASDDVHDHDDYGNATRRFAHLVRNIDDVPKDFPDWDDRPLFVSEQHAVLEYLATIAALELVADRLIDGDIGQVLLARADVITRNDVTNDYVFDINRMPANLLDRPVAIVTHQVGNIVLETLKNLDSNAEDLDKLFLIEATVMERTGIDISTALEASRSKALDMVIDAYEASVVDIREYEFPELGNSAVLKGDTN